METNFIVYILHGESFVTEVDGACKQPLLEGNNYFLLVCSFLLHQSFPVSYVWASQLSPRPSPRQVVGCLFKSGRYRKL